MLAIYYGFILILAFAPNPCVLLSGGVTTRDAGWRVDHPVGLRADRHLCAAPTPGV